MTTALVTNPFATLSSDEVDADERLDDSARPIPLTPVPSAAPPPRFHHSRHGEASATWTYRDDVGRLLGYVVRFDHPEGKEILPRTWCRLPDGRSAWCWRALPVPQPLYGLDRLAARPDASVLVVEGEKTADAAADHFPKLVVVTWPGGTNAVGRADWTVLAGRRVFVWPDADAPGRKAADEVARLALEAGAASVGVVILPDGLIEGWDLADSIPASMNLKKILATATVGAPTTELPVGYAMVTRGLVWQDPENVEKPDLHLCGPFDVLAETRDTEGGSWGVLLEWHDNDDRRHRLAVPRSSLAGDGAEVRKVLLDGGLYVSANRGAKDRLAGFLTAVRTSARVTATSRIGWHGSAFVLPDGCIGGSGEDISLQGSGAFEHAFRQKGTVDVWKNEIGRYAIGNSRLAVAISTAFAAALVGPCEAESGGLHFRGPSSIGKSTALLIAGSVWGGGDAGGYIRSWRATTNGLEGVAFGHNDALLCLDELAQIAPREAGEIAYLLNGAGKSRSARDGAARRAARWRLLFLSSGEIGLADKVTEDGRGKRLSAGQQVRIVDIPADAGAGHGLFEELHGFASAEEFARHLRSAAASYYGTAARCFLEQIADDLLQIQAAVAKSTKDFVDQYVPAHADGQVHRVAQRFALIAAAGEIAVTAKVLPWPAGEATRAAARVYSDWLDARGGIEPAEIRNGIDRVRSFLFANGTARFLPAWQESGDARLPLRDVAGFRKREGEGWDYYVTPSAWREEICAGLDSKALAGQLADRGHLDIPGSGSHRAKVVSVPGYGKLRLYHLPSRFLEAGEDA